MLRLPNGRDFNDDFWTAYYEAEAQVLRGEVRQVGQTRTRPNSIDAALVGYYKSTSFRNLAEKSQETFRRYLERDFRAIVGSAPLAHLKPSHLGQLIAERAEASPAAARVLLSAIRSFTRHCFAVGLIKHDPAIGTKTPKVANPDGYHTWTEDQN